MTETKLEEKREPPVHPKFPYQASHETYAEPQPILDPSCVMEQMDRGEGMGVDDEKTYHHTEK